MKDSEFYIGWKDKMPNSYKSFLRYRLMGMLVLGLLILAALVLLQKPVNNYISELGNVTEISGYYNPYPVPTLITQDEDLPADVASTLLLVGYGKSGAEGIMKKIEQEHGSLSGKKITIAGSLIYGDGHGVLELSKKENSFVSVADDLYKLPTPSTGEVETIAGEIIDPKCYFGAMKPAIGKIHKSCAIRCISGGIPPVLRVATAISDQYKYYLMVDQDGAPINEKVLDYVAEPVVVIGTVSEMSDWSLVFVQPGGIQLTQ